MDNAALQLELDRRFSTTESDRDVLRTGQLPEGLRARLRKGWGCLRFGIAVLGAGAGAVFGWNVRPVLAPEWPLSLVALTCAVLGAVVSLVLFSRRFKGMVVDRPVRAHTGLMRLEVREQAVMLVAEDGLTLAAVALKGFELPAGRYRAFFVDLSGPGDSEGPLQAVGLEPA